MSAITDTVDAIVNRTGLTPKGRNFFVTIDDNNTARFEVTSKRVNVYGTLKGEEEKMSQVVSLDNAASYINGYLFSYGFLNRRGDKITSSMQLKRENAMTAKSKKPAEKKTSTKKVKATSTPKKTEKAKPKAPKAKGHVVAYGLGEPVAKGARNKLIKSIDKANPDGVRLTHCLRILILENWDNDACIYGAEQLADEIIDSPDVNKVRRMLRRKGLWE